MQRQGLLHLEGVEFAELEILEMMDSWFKLHGSKEIDKKWEDLKKEIRMRYKNV